MMRRRRLNPFVRRWIWAKGDVISPCPTLKHAVDAALAVFMIDRGVEAVPDRHAFRDVLRKFRREFRRTDAGYILAPLDRRLEKQRAMQRPTYSKDRRRNRPRGRKASKEAMAAADDIVRQAVQERTNLGEIIAMSKHRSYLIEKAKMRLGLPVRGTFPSGANIGRAILRCQLIEPPVAGKREWHLRRLLPGEVRSDVEERQIRKMLKRTVRSAPSHPRRFNTKRPHTSLNGLTPIEFATRPREGQNTS
jgi:hypothetical protein